MSASSIPEMMDSTSQNRVEPSPPRLVASDLAGAFTPAADEFSYRPVPIAAPVAMFLGFASVMSLFAAVGVPIGLGGLVIGILAVRTILRSNNELSGMWLAATGTVLSALFLVSGIALHSYAYATEVPEGFARINFTRDIAKKGFTIEKGVTSIHPEVRALDGQRIFLKGYMYPERQDKGLTSFVLVKDNQQCCFGGQPQLTDMVLVEMDPGITVDYTIRMVSVAGVFRARAPQKAGSLDTVYKLDASHFTPSLSSF